MFCELEIEVTIQTSLEPDRYVLHRYRSGDKRSQLLPRGVMKRNARLH